MIVDRAHLVVRLCECVFERYVQLQRLFGAAVEEGKREREREGNGKRKEERN